MGRVIVRATLALALVLAVTAGLAWGATRLAPRSPAPLADPPVDGVATTDPGTDDGTGGPRTATVVVGGGLHWHDGTWQSAAVDAARTGRGTDGLDLDPMFAAVRPLVRDADVAICHEVGPFAGPGADYQSFPELAGPPAVAEWLGRAGWDVCTTTSPHALDGGYAALEHTADLLEDAGVAHVGTFRSLEERRQPVMVTTEEDVAVAVVAGTEDLPAPADRPWALSEADPKDLLWQAHRARRAGADVVVVHLAAADGGATPSAERLALVEELTASPDIDLVVGSSQVVQPVTQVNGTWVAHGTGAMMSQLDPALARTYEGITLEVTFTETADGEFETTDAAYVPLVWDQWNGEDPIRVRRVLKALRGGHGDRDRLTEARAAIRAAVQGLGAAPGLEER